MQAERAQRRLVAGDEEHYRRARFVDVLIPLARRDGERVEALPGEPLAADERMPGAAVLERREEQARRLLLRACALARTQHLREERHGLEHRPALDRVDVLNYKRVVRIAVPVAVLLQQLAQRLPAVAVHRRRMRRALMLHKPRQIAAAAID